MIKNELLNIQQLYESEIAILMYKFQKRTLPFPIQQLFQLKPCQIKTRSDLLDRKFGILCLKKLKTALH